MKLTKEEAEKVDILGRCLASMYSEFQRTAFLAGFRAGFDSVELIRPKDLKRIAKLKS